MSNQKIISQFKANKKLLCFFVVFSIGFSKALVFEQSIKTNELEPGVPIKRSISPQEIHYYNLHVATNQFVLIKISAPEGLLYESIVSSDSQNVVYARFDMSDGFAIKIISEQADLLIIKLTVNEKSENGRYTILLQENRQTTIEDKSLLAAKIQYDEAFFVRAKRRFRIIAKSPAKIFRIS